MEEYSFDINQKKGTASEKTVEEILQNKNKYNILKNKLIFDTNHRMGVDFLDEYEVPSGFDVSALGDSAFKQRCLQKYFLPFSNEQINKFISIDKYALNTPFYGNVRGKNVYGTYMISNENGKPLIFALTISRGTQDNEDMTDFSIKLDMLVAGQEWFQLARFDSMGAGHPNYISEDGEPIKNISNIEFIPTPHIHINSEEAQVLFSTKKNCEFMPARYIEQLKDLRNSSDKNFFKASLDTFLQFCNTKTKINEKISNDYLYNARQHLFDDEDTLKMGKITYSTEQNSENLENSTQGLEE